MNFSGKVVVITGGGGGIGSALAVECARLGANVAVSDVDHRSLKKTMDKLSAFDIHASSHIVDVTDRERVVSFAEEVVAEHGQVDVLINNAGVLMSQSTEDSSLKELQWIININIWGVINCSQAFLPYLKGRPDARIVNLSSILGLIGSHSMPIYSMTKFAVRGFSESLRLEMLGSNVKVCTVHPGGVRNTNIISEAKIHTEISDGSKTLGSASDAAKKFDQMYGFSTPAETAEQIIAGVKLGKARIHVGRDSRFIDRVSRLFPVAYPKLVGFYFTYLGPKQPKEETFAAATTAERKG